MNGPSEARRRQCRQCGSPLDSSHVAEVCLGCALEHALEPGTIFEASSVAQQKGTPDSTSGRSALLGRFGDYELLEEIARGGIGVVFKAKQVSLDRLVAVKMLLFGSLASAETVQRFRTEAAAAASLQHPNIVAVHEVGFRDSQHFIAMDYVAGRSLAGIVREGPLPPERAAGYMKAIAEAMHFAHERNILHRDLKPSNVLVDEHDQPKVTDFGLAKRLEKETELTLSGQVLGSPNYMPPEQAAARRGVVGKRSDVYSLGAILYHLLAGRAPFVGETLTHTLQLVQNSDPVSPRVLNPNVPRDLETICLKCLEKEPGKRYQTAQALAEELGRVLSDEPIQARPVSQLTRAWRWCRRKPVMAALSLGSALLLIVMAIGSALAAWQISEERTRAELGELSARRVAYAMAMDLAQRFLDANSLGRAQELLNRQRPKSGQLDLRGWEWRYLWQQGRSAAIGTLCQHSNLVGSLAVSPDGNWVAIGDHHLGGLSIWNWRSRQEAARLSVGEDTVYVAFSPREPLLACAGVTRFGTSAAHSIVRLWDGNSQQFVADLPLTGVCRGLAFAEDGRTLATATFAPDSQIVLWNVAERQKRASHVISACPDVIAPFAFSGDLTVAAQVMTDARVRVIDLVSGTTRWTRRAGNDLIDTVAFSRNGKLLATGAGMMESPIRLWDVETGSEMARLDGHHLWVSDLIFLPDGKTLASASADQTIRLWDFTHLDNIPPPRTLLGHQHEVWRIALMPDNRTLVSGAKDGLLLFWDTSGDVHSSAHLTLPGPFRAWRFGTNEETLVTCDREGRVSAWRGPNFRQKTSLFQLGPDILTPRFSGDGRWLAAGSSNGLVEVWDLQERARLNQFRASLGQTAPQFFLDQGKRLVTRDLAENFYDEWNVATGERTKRWRGLSGRSVSACTPDEKSCLFLSDGGTGLFREMSGGRETTLALDFRYSQDLAFSADGKLFAAASDFGLAKVWETASRAEVASIRSVLLGMHSIAFSPDGSRLAIGGNGAEAIKLWDLNSRQELLSLAASGTMFSSTAFSPNGNVVGSLNREGMLHLWRAPSWAEIEIAEKNAKAAP